LDHLYLTMSYAASLPNNLSLSLADILISDILTGFIIVHIVTCVRKLQSRFQLRRDTIL
jgi:uncharacterized integral membrane protein